MSRRVLIIEDNRDIADLVKLHLADCSAQADTVHNGTAGLTRAQQQTYDLIILDLMLPGVDGLEVCRQLRKHSTYIPILMLTAKSSELDRVLGLELGADDYLTKPFSVRELIARVKALFRRIDAIGSSPAALNDVIEQGALRIDCEKHVTTVAGKPVPLTAREFELLVHFARHPGRVYRREQLLDQVWGAGYEGYAHTVNSHINRLRAKIEENPAQPHYILTVWGVGYKFADTS